MNAKKKITIQEIAKALNTSPSTVSRALQDHPRIGAEMRERVKKYAQEQDYQPDFRASSLRKGSGRTIGVLVPQIDYNFFARIVRGIDEVATQADYNVLICQSNDSYKREVQLVKSLLYGKVDGLIASISIETLDGDHFNMLTRRGLPLVIFDKVIESMKVSKVLIDDHMGTYISMQHLISNGYKRIAYFAGPQYLNIYYHRTRGYIDALKDSGIEIDENLIFYNTMERVSGYEAMQKILQMEYPPDAICSCSDFAALGALVCAKENGIKVPDQIAITGFANESFGSFLEPSMTSIEQNPVEMGRKSAELLIEQMENIKKDSIPRTVTLKPSLVIRESSAYKSESNPSFEKLSL